MKFTEKRALELIEQHGLAPGTFKTWKNRQSIPDKYETGIKKKITSSHDKQQSEDLLKALSFGKLNVKAICRLAGIQDYYVIDDARRGKSTLSLNDLIAMKKAINTVRNEVKKVLSEFERKNYSDAILKQFEHLYSRKEMVWISVFNHERLIRHKFDGWMMGRRPFPVEEVDKLKGYLLVFLTETTI